MTKYAFLTKEIMQRDYDELGTLSAIGRKYDMPTASVKSCARRLGIKMDPPGGKCKYTVNEDFFELDTEEGFYVGGFMAADGNITLHKYWHGLLLGLSRKDRDHLVKIKNAMNFTGTISDHSYLNKNNNKIIDSSWLKIYCSKKIIIDISNNFNVVPQKTFTYQFPQRIIDHELVRHFIRGYFDGDGCFCKDKRNSAVSFELLGTQSFLEVVRDILERDCNLRSNAVVRKTKNIYRLRYYKNDLVSKISTYLYGNSTIYLQRKFDKISHLIR